MSFIKPGVRALCLFEENSGTVFQLDGADISPQSSLQLPKLLRKNGRGGQKELARQVEMNIKHSDADLHALMDAADNDTTQWQFIFVGLNSFVFCYEENTFNVEETPQFDPESEDYPFTLTYTLPSGEKIGWGENMLAAWARSQGEKFWEDEDSDDVADPFILTGADSSTFDGQQTINDSDGGSDFDFPEIVFPLEGLTLTIAIEIVTAWTTSGLTSVGITSADADDNPLGSVSTSEGDPGRFSTQFTLPEGTFKITPIFGGGGEGTLVLDEPSLRADGKTDYTKY